MKSMLIEGADEVYRLACGELRGGNHSAVYAAKLPGLAGWVSCHPLRPSPRGGDEAGTRRPCADSHVPAGASMSDHTQTASPYDSIGGAYDLVGGLDVYHRICWGVSTGAYRAFADRARLACAGGLLLDAGCGSMLFSAGAHQRNDRGAVVGADASVRMLRMARRRLGSAHQPEKVVLLRADVLDNPFRPAIFDVVLCLHVAHVIADLNGLVDELRRVLKPGGRLFLTSVVLVGRWRDRYLGALARRGIMASPRGTADILAALRDRFGAEPDHRLVGSMLFTETICPTRGREGGGTSAWSAGHAH
jgi:ubiquinone/menaquinone biosynthesis C-methylase UbiE